MAFNIEDQRTMDREIRALQAAENELQIKGELITPDSYLAKLWLTTSQDKTP